MKHGCFRWSTRISCWITVILAFCAGQCCTILSGLFTLLTSQAWKYISRLEGLLQARWIGFGHDTHMTQIHRFTPLTANMSDGCWPVLVRMWEWAAVFYFSHSLSLWFAVSAGLFLLSQALLSLLLFLWNQAVQPCIRIWAYTYTF